MTTMPYRFLQPAIAACLVGLLSVTSIPGAFAQESTTTNTVAEPTNTVAEPTNTVAGPLVEVLPLEGEIWDLPFESLGYAPRLAPELYTGTIELDVPPIDGLGVARLRGVVAANPVESGALVTVYANGSPVAEAQIAPGAAETIDLDLPADTTTVTVASHPLAQPLVECPVRTAAIELREPSVVYQGTPARPQDPDDFLPVALHGVTIAIAERSPDVDRAVLEIVTSLARRYPNRFAIDVIAVSDGDNPRAVADPFRRTIWLGLNNADDAEIVDGDGFAVIRPGSDDLPGPLVSHPTPIGIGESGQMALTPHLARTDVDEAAGHVELPIVASQATLGGPHRELTIRAGGRVTHLAGGLPDATSVALWAGDRLLTTTPVDDVGRFDLEQAVDDELLSRDTVFLITADAPRTNEDYCDGGPPLRLEIDEGSWLGGSPGQPLEIGFTRHPQALLPEHQLFVGEALDDLEAAAGLVALLQNASGNPLALTLGGPADTVTGPAVIVGGPSSRLDALGPPTPKGSSFSGTHDDEVDAVLFAAEHDGHDVLVLRSNQRGAQSRVVSLIRDKGFVELTGDTVGLVDDGLVKGRRDSTTDRALLAALGPNGSDRGPSSTAQLFLYGLLAAAAVMGLALALGPIRALVKR
ncbi:MAG: hypothetical protein GY929_13755 [Actinomycetia bacterium]|nr:hypothetical protein [Actinomycetes bacterium]